VPNPLKGLALALAIFTIPVWWYVFNLLLEETAVKE